MGAKRTSPSGPFALKSHTHKALNPTKRPLVRSAAVMRQHLPSRSVRTDVDTCICMYAGTLVGTSPVASPAGESGKPSGGRYLRVSPVYLFNPPLWKQSSCEDVTICRRLQRLLRVLQAPTPPLRPRSLRPWPSGPISWASSSAPCSSWPSPGSSTSPATTTQPSSIPVHPVKPTAQGRGASQKWSGTRVRGGNIFSPLAPLEPKHPSSFQGKRSGEEFPGEAACVSLRWMKVWIHWNYIA
jgi:hypothetical protein